jgi:nucleotide-binding universal stress UspA family protein
MSLIRKILVPFDWSASSRRAFHLGASLAREHDAQLLVLHVVPLGAMLYGPAHESYLAHVREELSCLEASDPPGCPLHLVGEGDPALVILRVAREQSCDLIVMGTHGRSGVNRLLLGSVAEEVVRKAPCPVLTVKAAGGEAEDRCGFAPVGDEAIDAPG